MTLIGQTGDPAWTDKEALRLIDELPKASDARIREIWRRNMLPVAISSPESPWRLLDDALVTQCRRRKIKIKPS